MTEIAAYLRVSTQSQKDDRSHLRQRKTIAQWTERNGHDPGQWDDFHIGADITDSTDWDPLHGLTTGDITWYEDLAISGQADDRESYKQLMSEYDRYDLVVVRELSRFGRSPERVMQDLLEISRSGTEFVSITEDIDTTSAMGKFVSRILAAVNGFFSDIRQEQAEKMIERRRAEGKPIGRPRKLSDQEIEQVQEWNDEGHSYNTITVLVEHEFGTSISKNTVKRYVNEVDV